MKLHSLQLQELSFRYSIGNTKLNVFKELSHSLPINKFVQLAGPTGAGKSTLLKILATLVDPNEGAYLINGAAVADFDEVGRTQFRKIIGYIGPHLGLIQNKSCRENLQLSFHSFPEISAQQMAAAIDKIAHELRIESVLELRPTEIPRSAAISVALARALVHKPELLLIAQSIEGRLLEYIFGLMQEGRLASVFYAGDLSTCPLVPHTKLLVSSNALAEAA